MGFVVHAVPRVEFKAWLNHQRQAVSTGGPAQELFEAKCGACHEVRGTSAAGIFGPDLTHVGSRTTLAAAMMRNTPQNLALWLGGHARRKAGRRNAPDHARLRRARPARQLAGVAQMSTAFHRAAHSPLAVPRAGRCSGRRLPPTRPRSTARLEAVGGAPGLRGWFGTVDHKTIGIRYIITAFVFLAIGGIEALVMRVQLAQPDAPR